MKRFYMLLLAALLIMTFCACQKTEEAPAETAAPEVAATEVKFPVQIFFGRTVGISV